MSLAVLRRRLVRVNSRAHRDDPAYAVLDDVFVLWRALEASTDRRSALTVKQKVIAAVLSAIDYGSANRLPSLPRLISSLDLLASAPDNDLRLWYPEGPEPREARRLLEQRLDAISSHATKPTWPVQALSMLAETIYELRCAIFHASVETDQRLTLQLAPAMRSFMQELLILRAAELAQVPPLHMEQALAEELTALLKTLDE